MDIKNPDKSSNHCDIILEAAELFERLSEDVQDMLLELLHTISNNE